MARIVGSTDHRPNQPNGHLDDFSSPHPGGTHFLFGDGAVTFISDQIEHDVFQALGTRAGNEKAAYVP